MNTAKVLSASFAGNGEDQSRKLVTKPLQKWTKALKSMRVHLQSDKHTQSCEAKLGADAAVPQALSFNNCSKYEKGRG